MNFIVEHWLTIAVCAVVIANFVCGLIRFKNLTAEQRVEKIKNWLLQAVMMAEKEYGSGTGALKLSVVYAEFCKQLPWLAQAISFEVFSKYVDDALVRMKEILASNKSIAAVVENGEGVA